MNLPIFSSNKIINYLIITQLIVYKTVYSGWHRSFPTPMIQKMYTILSTDSRENTLLKVERILFIVSVVRIFIHHTNGYALRYFTKKSIVYVLTLLSSWHCKYFRSSSRNGVLWIFVTENCVDAIENRRSQLDLLYIEYGVHDGNLIGWSGIRTKQTEFRLVTVTMKFHHKINTV